MFLSNIKKAEAKTPLVDSKIEFSITVYTSTKTMKINMNNNYYWDGSGKYYCAPLEQRKNFFDSLVYLSR